MPKGYWISAHRKKRMLVNTLLMLNWQYLLLKKPEAVFLLRGLRLSFKRKRSYGANCSYRISKLRRRSKAYDSSDYKRALKELEGGADRDLRIVEGV